MTFDEFLRHCDACGGNWTAMLISGIKTVAPGVYEQMPDMNYSFDDVVFIVNHLCYDRPHFRYNVSLNGLYVEHSGDGNFIFREATKEEMALPFGEFHERYNMPKNPVEAECEFGAVSKMDFS